MITLSCDIDTGMNPGIYDLVGSIDLCSSTIQSEIGGLPEINMENTLNSMELTNAKDS